MNIKYIDNIWLNTSRYRNFKFFIIRSHDYQTSRVVFAANKIKQTFHVIHVTYDIQLRSFLNHFDTLAFEPSHDSLMVLNNLLSIFIYHLLLENIIFRFVNKHHLRKVFWNLYQHRFRVLMKISYWLGVILILTLGFLITSSIKNNNDFVLFQSTSNFTPIAHFIIILFIWSYLHVKDCIEIILI
jgi:hypothetical protein